MQPVRSIFAAAIVALTACGPTPNSDPLDLPPAGESTGSEKADKAEPEKDRNAKACDLVDAALSREPGSSSFLSIMGKLNVAGQVSTPSRQLQDVIGEAMQPIYDADIDYDAVVASLRQARKACRGL
jgi:predicted small lipoprotein YifL